MKTIWGLILKIFFLFSLPCLCVRVCVCAPASRDSDLSTIISNLHNTRQHGMPEGQSASEHSSRTGHTGKNPRCAPCTGVCLCERARVCI